MSKVKTDNHNPEVKLELRRYFLRKYHAGTTPPKVLDCCQATGFLWSELRKEFECDYWGVDLQEKKGRLKIDSVRILDQPGWRHDVVDIDPYGSCWKHWFALLRHCDHPVTVFLTNGNAKIRGGADMDSWRMLGIEPLFQQFAARGIKPPQACMSSACGKLGVGAWLGAESGHGLTIAEAIEAENSGVPGCANARYFGVRLEPIRTDFSSQN